MRKARPPRQTAPGYIGLESHFKLGKVRWRRWIVQWEGTTRTYWTGPMGLLMNSPPAALTQTGTGILNMISVARAGMQIWLTMRKAHATLFLAKSISLCICNKMYPPPGSFHSEPYSQKKSMVHTTKIIQPKQDDISTIRIGSAAIFHVRSISKSS